MQGVEAPPEIEFHALHEAVISEDAALVRSLLASGCPLDALNGCGDAALHLATALSSPDITQALLAAGADPNTRNKFFSDTPLLAAVLAEQLASVEALLAAGADAQLCGCKGAVRVEAIWKHGANAAALANLAASAAPHTPLYQAATSGHLPIARALLRAGARFSPKEQGQLPQELRRAAVMQKLDAVRALRAAGALLGSPCSEALYAQVGLALVVLL
jgi:ankyrin repeat protein